MNACTTPELDRERSVCERYAKRVHAYGLCHLQDADAAEDLVQQVLLTVLQALRRGRVNDVDNLDRYVFGTCRNTVLDLRRGHTRRQRFADTASASVPTHYEENWDLADGTRLEQCLARLEARARAVVVATFVDGRKAEEICRSMNLSAGHVRVIRHRALAQLQRWMGDGPRS
jgi:RNA polymerase sigma-70 factor (ECF subfamily)